MCGQTPVAGRGAEEAADMDDLFCIHPGISQQGYAADGLNRAAMGASSSTVSDLSEVIKAQISGHPRFPALVSAYIDCRKIGAPPEVVSHLEEIRQKSHPVEASSQLRADPELDDFMESYCQVLHRFKEELSKPFEEATSFLSSIETQLVELCRITSPAPAAASQSTTTSATAPSAGEGGGSAEEEHSSGEVADTESQDNAAEIGSHELKEMLLNKYSAYLSSLKKDFLKKRKKGKLPKDARTELMAWWKTHYRWPYPTEEEKAKLAEVSGLDLKQINNWFINQRKRHWKPSEDMRSALLEGVAGGSGVLYWDTRTIDP